EEVLIETKHDLRQLLVAVVVQHDRLASAHEHRGHINARVDRVFHPELPVIRTGTAHRIARGGAECAPRHVGDGKGAPNSTLGNGSGGAHLRSCHGWYERSRSHENADCYSRSIYARPIRHFSSISSCVMSRCAMIVPASALSPSWSTTSSSRKSPRPSTRS